MASDLPAESKASLEKSLEELSIQNKRPGPDISRLSLSATDATTTFTKGSKDKNNTKKKKAAVADSWEDDLSDDEKASTTEIEKEDDTKAKFKSPLAATKSEGPLAPPSTPSTNLDGDDYGLPQWGRVPPTTTSTSTSSTRDSARARPEKQTAVASRMIAGALGIRAPKRTEEQRAYDRAMKEKEIKRRNKEKEEEAKARQEEERAKAAVWDA
ncbi:conserved hypothetical protein [Talaromyces stipitatus ATCC 10500]|uniref:Ubiquitin-like protein smt3 n=1 Tax=Talaromyces stipitatus (strain ATCC 10500 / CBS 375.48 / QM 6759 / NRRL 1006) TaxID=441959 RepID=B8LVL1_TALSN|nr:uncharacterized protein TSTA_075150 [Talaromyces stipitatus ATCC 10500]EED24141.1 conserved hypothetical protein [Talaromyces stipitatus ATCC 10500]